MTTQNITPSQIFQSIQEEFARDFPNLELIFLPYETSHPVKTIIEKKPLFSGHPAANEVLKNAEKTTNNTNTGSFCAAFAAHEKKQLFGFKTERECLALCMIDTHETAVFENQALGYRFFAYITAFMALDQHICSSKKQKYKKFKTVEFDSETKPLERTLHRLQLNLMAESFAAMMLEHHEGTGTIRTIIKTLCQSALKPAKQYKPEDHPVPLALDGVNIVYKDLIDDRPDNCSNIEHVYNMAREISDTYDETSLRQWVRFISSAQDMAWAGFSENEILSAAIYVSDSPNIRANAHICSELLNTTPVPLKNNEFYNPFNTAETNERMHLRLCRTTFMDLIEKVGETNDPSLFIKEAREQTLKLLDGHPIGWCAPALIETENAYRLCQEYETFEEEEITDAFHGACAQVKWPDLQRLARRFLSLKRLENEVSIQSALRIIEQDERYTPYKSPFEILAAQQKAA